MIAYIANFNIFAVEPCEIVDSYKTSADVRRLVDGCLRQPRRMALNAKNHVIHATEKGALNAVAERLELEIESLEAKSKNLKRKLAEVRSHLAKEQY